MTQRTGAAGPEGLTLREALSRLSEVLTRPGLPPPRLSADVFETPDGTSYMVEVPVPGLSADEVRVQASGDLLTVEVLPRVAASEPGRAYLTQELRWEPQARVFTFPTAIDVDNIQARIERGMLRVRVPKAEGAPSRVITVEG